MSSESLPSSLPSDPESLSSSQSTNNDGNEKKKKGFRINAKHLSITYPRCDIDKEVVQEFYESKLDGIEHMVVAREKHQDGAYHLHVYIALTKRCDVRNAKYFDIDGHHPNIQACYSPRSWYEYVKKDSDYIESFKRHSLSSHNFIRVEADHKAWVSHMEKQSLTEGFNNVPLGIHWIDLNMTGKKRNWLIVGPASVGKTAWLEDTFENHYVYKAINDKRGYFFDNYEGEKYIVYDDWIPGRDLILNVSNVYKTRTPVHGGCRNAHRFWPIKQERVQIILTNVKPTYVDDPAFTTRFNVLDLFDNQMEQQQQQYDPYCGMSYHDFMTR